MDNPYVLMLSAIVFLPALAAILLLLVPKDREDVIRHATLAVTGVVFALTVLVFLVPGIGGQFAYVGEAAAYMQYAFSVPWIPSFDIEYFLGVDGISFPLVMLTGLVCLLAMWASWSIKKYVKAYCVLFLLLETGMLGVFMALDFFLFYVFWEVMLLPMYFLIGVWGGPRREYAAIKFFLYTLVGSVLMLIAILLLYFNSDLRTLAEYDFDQGGAVGDLHWEHMHLGDNIDARVGRAVIGDGDRDQACVAFLYRNEEASRALDVRFTRTDGGQTTAVFDAAANSVEISLADGADTAADVVAAVRGNETLASVVSARLPEGCLGTGRVHPGDDNFSMTPFDAKGTVHTFNLLALAAMGQHTDRFSESIQWWAFLLLFIGFLIKVPAVPFHTWLPDAHVEAPTPISMILAGVLLKMGGYGIIRICYPICPHGGYDLMYLVCTLGVISMVYGAFAALAQKDFKRMVAYSSVSHMGYVVLGLGVWSVNQGTLYNADYWNMGVKGAMFQMIGHGISSAGMFFLVGVIYDRVHHRNLDEFGGLFGKMPVYTALSIGIFFAGLGLPGLCGFIGEVLVVLSVWSFNPWLAVISASVVILTAAYILWAIQRVYLGAEYKGPHEEALVPSTRRENTIAGTLLVLAILFGIFPYPLLLRYMDPTIDRQVNELAAWTEFVKEPLLKKKAAARAAERPRPDVEQTTDARPQADSVATGLGANVRAISLTRGRVPPPAASDYGGDPLAGSGL